MGVGYNQHDYHNVSGCVKRHNNRIWDELHLGEDDTADEKQNPDNFAKGHALFNDTEQAKLFNKR